MPTTLTLDRYAELQAELDAGSLRDEVLARAGLSVEEWTAAQRLWLDRMGNELSLGGFELTNRYAQAFLGRQRALHKPRAPAAIEPPQPGAPESATSAAGAPPTPVPAIDTPTYLATPPVKRASPALAGTSMGFVAPKGPALPFAKSPASPPPPAASSPPAPKRAPAALTGTSMAFVAPKGPALPFAAGPEPKPAAATSPPTSSPLRGASDAAAPPASASGTAPAAMPPAAMPPVQRAPAALAGTSMAFVAPKAPALPFAPGVPAAKSADAPAAAPPVKRPPAALTGTSMALIAPKGPALPFARGTAPVADPAPAAPAPPRVELSLEQYASLCVELALDPSSIDATLARYRLTAEQRGALDDDWQRRFATDAALRGAFDRARAAYEAWLLSTRRT